MWLCAVHCGTMAALAIPLVELTSMLAEHRRSVMTKKIINGLAVRLHFLDTISASPSQSQNLHQTSALRLRTAKGDQFRGCKFASSLSTGVPYA
jgi:hypothetical protein